LSFKNQIFNISSDKEFNDLSIKIFDYQYKNNRVYQKFCDLLHVIPSTIKTIQQIPFLPIEFFKSHEIKTGDFNETITFLSSGTTGSNQSKHYVKDLEIYELSFKACFKQFYGNIEDFCILALLPSYMEREGSSLIYMTECLVKESKHPLSGFYLNEFEKLINKLDYLNAQGQKTILLGVSFALLDLAESHRLNLKNNIVMETGGMKGRRKELTRKELHSIYQDKLGVDLVHSEYGMTELLSQAYSKRNGLFSCPNWMKVMIRDVNDPFHYLDKNMTGGLNIIDLANIDSCCFIATQDLGKMIHPNSFEVLGRFDNSDLRGCNLLIN